MDAIEFDDGIDVECEGLEGYSYDADVADGIEVYWVGDADVAVGIEVFWVGDGINVYSFDAEHFGGLGLDVISISTISRSVALMLFLK